VLGNRVAFCLDNCERRGFYYLHTYFQSFNVLEVVGSSSNTKINLNLPKQQVPLTVLLIVR